MVDTAPAVKGRPVSGKTWKGARRKATSVAVVPRELRPGFSARREKEAQAKAVRDQERTLRDASSAEKEATRLRAEENARRRAANEKRNTVVQVIKDPRKVRRMTKKQVVRGRIAPMKDTSALERH